MTWKARVLPAVELEYPNHDGTRHDGNAEAAVDLLAGALLALQFAGGEFTEEDEPVRSAAQAFDFALMAIDPDLLREHAAETRWYMLTRQVSWRDALVGTRGYHGYDR